ncbi:hypothetical protein MGG_17497, partial [Pyricularia oryzae 70-15]
DFVLLIGWKDGKAQFKLKTRAYYARKNIVKLRPPAFVFITNTFLAGKHYFF